MSPKKEMRYPQYTSMIGVTKNPDVLSLIIPLLLFRESKFAKFYLVLGAETRYGFILVNEETERDRHTFTLLKLAAQDSEFELDICTGWGLEFTSENIIEVMLRGDPEVQRIAKVTEYKEGDVKRRGAKSKTHLETLAGVAEKFCEMLGVPSISELEREQDSRLQRLERGTTEQEAESLRELLRIYRVKAIFCDSNWVQMDYLESTHYTGYFENLRKCIGEAVGLKEPEIFEVLCSDSVEAEDSEAVLLIRVESAVYLAKKKLRDSIANRETKQNEKTKTH